VRRPEPGARDRPRVAIVLIGAALLMWPTLLNWHPYLFWDTYSYFLQGKVYAQLLLAWAELGPVPPEAAVGWPGAAGRMLAHDPSIRSPTWSLVTYALAVPGGFWLLAVANALLAAATVELALVRQFGVPPRGRLLAIVSLALLTSLPWFASYLMPDLYAGLLVLAAAALAFSWQNLRWGERLALIGLYLAAITFHPSHLLLAAGLAGLTLLLPAAWAERRRRLACLGLPVPAAAMLLLAIGWLGFGAATLSPHGPPFLLARSPCPRLSRGHLPASRLGDLRRARPAGAKRAGVPLAPGRQLLEHGSCHPSRCARRGEGDIAARRPGRPDRPAAGVARQRDHAARPLRARRFRARARRGGHAGGLHLRLPAARTRGRLGAERVHGLDLCLDRRGAVGRGHLVASARATGGRVGRWLCSS
jgi:hypothetical protein